MDTRHKVLDYKTYNSIGHFATSRVGPKDHHIDSKTELLCTTAFPLHQKCYLYIEEKMDGSNVTVVRLNGQIYALGRSGYDCKDSNLEQHRMFYRWVEKNKEKFEKLLPNEHDRVVGEWMVQAHGTIYKDLPSFYMAFDLFYNKEQQSVRTRIKAVEDVGLYNVPLIYKGDTPISLEIASTWPSMNPDAEGVVYRLEKVNKNHPHEFNKPWIIAKFVKQDKVDGKYIKAFSGEEIKPIWNTSLEDPYLPNI